MLQVGRREQLVILVLLAALLFGGGYQYAQHKASLENQPVLVPVEEQNEREPSQLVVHVSGAVITPGVYYLEEGARVIDAVQLAQPAPEADLDGLNLAAPLTDGQPVPVPFKLDAGPLAEDMAANTVQGHQSSAAGTKVNINTADAAQLETLPGIGPTLAQRIIDYRQANGNFKAIDEIQNVSGIGAKKYESIKDLISVY